MECPDETIAAGATGNREVRMLQSKGEDYVVYRYLDLETMTMQAEYSILLRKEDGSIEHLFIVPGGKELVVKHESEKNLKNAEYRMRMKKRRCFSDHSPITFTNTRLFL